MNIPFTTLIIFILISPGLMFIHRYHWGMNKSAKSFYDKDNITMTLVKGVMGAGIIHIAFNITICVLNGIFYLLNMIPLIKISRIPLPDIQNIFIILTNCYNSSNIPQVTSLGSVSTIISEDIINIVIYFILINAISYFFGHFLKRIVFDHALDHRYAGLFRFNDKWGYIFSGEDKCYNMIKEIQYYLEQLENKKINKPKQIINKINKEIEFFKSKLIALEDSFSRTDCRRVVVIGAVVEVNNEALLYVGVYHSHRLLNGELDIILLDNAYRRKLNAPRKKDKKTQKKLKINHDPCYYRIDGNFICLQMKDIKSLNVYYDYLDNHKDKKLNMTMAT